jgi:hypothetical protein
LSAKLTTLYQNAKQKENKFTNLTAPLLSLGKYQPKTTVRKA